jgi:signal-transduction protein with cAMP-binding, CBS, and nucleotidyltransferase domain
MSVSDGVSHGSILLGEKVFNSIAPDDLNKLMQPYCIVLFKSNDLIVKAVSEKKLLILKGSVDVIFTGL